MRTNIVIDDRLMRDAMAAAGARSKREAVEMGLQLLLARQNQAAIKSLRGALDWQGDLDALRTDAATSTGALPA
jgi:Arc/MetJ family transcription regulator